MIPQSDHKSKKPSSAQPKEIEQDDLPQYIEMLQAHQVQCEKEGRYVEAEVAKNRLIELKKQLEMSKKEDIKGRQVYEKAQLEQEHIEEFREFNDYWDKKMADFNEQAQGVEEQTILRHQEEMERFLEELEKALPTKPKDSTELLNLKKIQLSLAKKTDYIEAHKIQQRCMKLEKEETDRYLVQREKKILNQKSQLEQKQINELNALRKRISTGQDEQRKARSLELERLLQKYQNMRKELEAQHQLELLRITSPNLMAGSLFRTQGVKRSTYNSQMSGINIGIEASNKKR